ncbi:hypothetical protein K439DRAFT_1166569 [Ramaria rubella]|nr:hypothetical protein K439DRAFT_1166569 [Ramaria rubella]
MLMINLSLPQTHVLRVIRFSADAVDVRSIQIGRALAPLYAFPVYHGHISRPIATSQPCRNVHLVSCRKNAQECILIITACATATPNFPTSQRRGYVYSRLFPHENSSRSTKGKSMQLEEPRARLSRSGMSSRYPCIPAMDPTIPFCPTREVRTPSVLMSICDSLLEGSDLLPIHLRQ